MRSLVDGMRVFCLLSVVAAPSVTARASKPPDPMGWKSLKYRSPEIHEDGRVTFRYFAPAADRVAVGGSLSRWRFRDMQKREDGLWECTVGPVEPDLYLYGFSVDGAPPCPDPRNRRVHTQNMLSTALSYLDVPAPDHQPVFYAYRDVPHGDVRIHWMKSRLLEEVRRLYVYTPPGYGDASSHDFPVLYLLHGGGHNETAWVENGRVNLIMDNLIAEDKAQPMVIVMPYTNGKSPYKGGSRTANFEEFSAYLMEEILPFVETHYHVSRRRDETAVAGFSIGAALANMIGLRNLDRFSWVGLFSGGHRMDEDFKKTFMPLEADMDILNRKLKLLWMSGPRYDASPGTAPSGRQSPLYRYLLDHKVRFVSAPDRYGHSMQTCRHILYEEFLPRLFQ